MAKALDKDFPKNTVEHSTGMPIVFVISQDVEMVSSGSLGPYKCPANKDESRR